MTKGRNSARKQRLASLPPLDPAQRYNVDEAARYLRLAPSTIWKLIKAKNEADRLPVIRHAGRVFVSGAVIAERSRPQSLDRTPAAASAASAAA